MPLPTYGYQCTQCQHEFSVFQNMKDEPVRICPECSSAVKRLMYPVGIVFKGSGWYINDSRKPDTSESDEKAAKSDKSDKTDKSSGGDKPDTSTESKKPAVDTMSTSAPVTTK